MTDFKFYIDWNNDSDFDDSNEDITSYVMEARWNIGFSEPYQHVAGETRANLTLRNADKRFSPEYSSSPMYGSIVPKRLIKIENTASGTTRMYTGWVESYEPSTGVNGDLTCQVVGVGLKQFLETQEYYSPFWESVTVDEVISNILQSTTVPPAFGKFIVLDIEGQNLVDTHWVSTAGDILNQETGKVVLPYVGDTWETGVSAVQAINDLVQTERGWFFQDRSGSAVFWNRLHFISNDTVSGTINNTWGQLDYRYASEDIKNIVRVASYPRSISAGSAETLWSLNESKTISSGGSISFRARYTEPDSDSIVAGRSVVTPNIGDGSLVVSPVGASVSIENVESNARSFSLTIVNNDNDDVDVSTLVVKGQKLTTYNKEEFEAINATSVALYGKQVLSIDAKLINSSSYAQAIADSELANMSNPRGVVSRMVLEQRNSTIQQNMINWTIGSLINIVDDQTSHNADYRVMGEQHEWRAGDVHKVTYVIQRDDIFSYILIDVSGKNDIDGSRYIAV